MPFPKKPYVPLGATYAPQVKQTPKDQDDQHKMVHGPDFPQTAAARKSSVTEEDAAGPPVLDETGEVSDEVSGPDLSPNAAARPDRTPPEPDDE